MLLLFLVPKFHLGTPLSAQFHCPCLERSGPYPLKDACRDDSILPPARRAHLAHSRDRGNHRYSLGVAGFIYAVYDDDLAFSPSAASRMADGSLSLAARVDVRCSFPGGLLHVAQSRPDHRCQLCLYFFISGGSGSLSFPTSEPSEIHLGPCRRSCAFSRSRLPAGNKLSRNAGFSCLPDFVSCRQGLPSARPWIDSRHPSVRAIARRIRFAQSTNYVKRLAAPRNCVFSATEIVLG